MRAACFAVVLLAAPAGAAELRDFCPDRPGLDTPACIVDKGHVVIETGAAAWQRDRTPDSVTDTVTTGDVLARFGVTDTLEAFAGWTAYNHARIRDRATGTVTRRHGSGDVSFGVKQSLRNPGGDGTAVAVQLFATAPTGDSGFGSGGWTQGIIIPVQFELPGGFALALSPEIDRLPDTLRSGHHAAWAAVGGLAREFGKVTAGVELAVSRDDDPGAATTQVLADVTLAWAVSDRFQFDAEVDAGLDRDAPDLRVAVGIARRF